MSRRKRNDQQIRRSSSSKKVLVGVVLTVLIAFGALFLVHVVSNPNGRDKINPNVPIVVAPKVGQITPKKPTPQKNLGPAAAPSGPIRKSAEPYMAQELANLKRVLEHNERVSQEFINQINKGITITSQEWKEAEAKRAKQGIEVLEILDPMQSRVEAELKTEKDPAKLNWLRDFQRRVLFQQGIANSGLERPAALAIFDGLLKDQPSMAPIQAVEILVQIGTFLFNHYPRDPADEEARQKGLGKCLEAYEKAKND